MCCVRFRYSYFVGWTMTWLASRVPFVLLLRSSCDLFWYGPSPIRSHFHFLSIFLSKLQNCKSNLVGQWISGECLVEKLCYNCRSYLFKSYITNQQFQSCKYIFSSICLVCFTSFVKADPIWYPCAEMYSKSCTMKRLLGCSSRPYSKYCCAWMVPQLFELELNRSLK